MKCYYFEWQGGGYNHVIATSKKQAIQKAIQLGQPSMSMTTTLVPLPETFTTDKKKQAAMEARWSQD